MFPFKTILCPTDFSEPSEAGLRLAGEMASKYGSEIIVLNVHRPIPHLPMPRIEAEDVTFDISAYEDQVRQEQAQRLGQFVAGVLGDGIEPRLLVRMGRPAKEILACAAREKADAIFIATHGRTGLSHMVFGSVAEMVVRYAPCPVLTLREYA